MIKSPWIVMAFISIGACSQLPEDTRFPENEGWRQGKVDRVDLGSDAALADTPECRSAYAALPPQTRYVRIHYVRYGQSAIHRAVPSPADVTLAQGDTVYINVSDCRGRLALPAPASQSPTRSR